MIEQGIAGRYDLEFCLGTNAYSSVHQALDRHERKLVALRLFSAEACAAEATRERLIAWASDIARLDAPHAGRIHTWGIADDRVYVIGDLATGGSLRALLNAKETLPTDVAIRIASETLEALEVAHGQGIRHGDLRPENILFDAHGGVIVTDFGLREALDESELGFRIETPGEATGAALRDRGGSGAPADVYQVVALLYEMLVGRVPPTGLAARSPVAFSPRRANPRVPAWLDRVVVRGLGADAESRYLLPAALRLALASPPQPSASGRSERRRFGRGWPLAFLAGIASFFGRLVVIGIPAVIGGLIVAAVATVFLVGRVVVTGPVTDLALVETPNFVGLDYQSASEKAMTLGINVARNSERPTDDRPRDTVLNQWPVPGTSLRHGSVIRLSVSSGLKAPSVVGRKLDDVKQDIQTKGWQIGTIENSPTLWAEPGTIIQQTPGADEIVAGPVPLKLAVAVMPPNLALNQPSRASSGSNVQAAFDDKLDTAWSAGALPPSWIEIDLGGPHTIQRVELVAAMKPDGWAGHEVWLIDSKGKEQKAYVFGGEFKDGQVLSKTFSPGVNDIVRVRIVTSGSVSIAGWKEIRVY